jgi:hypothetical protein
MSSGPAPSSLDTEIVNVNPVSGAISKAASIQLPPDFQVLEDGSSGDAVATRDALYVLSPPQPQLHVAGVLDRIALS